MLFNDSDYQLLKVFVLESTVDHSSKATGIREDIIFGNFNMFTKNNSE